MKLLLASLVALLSFPAFAQWETVSGNGNLKKETREASGYTAVASHGSMDVNISYGNSNTITLEADENLLPYIETSVDKGTLVIKSKKNTNLKTKNKIVVNVSLTKLTALRLSGSGNIKGNGDFSNNDKTEFSISGSGNMNFTFGTLNEVTVSISGSGNANLNGKGCNNITATISGSGNIDCSNVPCNDVFAKVSGSGNVRVYANKSIDARVSGSGNIYYKGTASKLNNKASGSGKIIKI
jgi:hypothetical protein